MVQSHESAHLADLLPPSLARLQSAMGKHRSGRKILLFGDYGAGKSFAATTAPGPLFVLDFHSERGIQHLVDLKRGDTVLEINSKEGYAEALSWAVKNASKIGTVIGDQANAVWEIWMDDWTTELGREELKGGDWKRVKPAWRKLHRDLIKAPFNVVYTCHVRDVRYEQREEAPGIQGKLEIINQIAPNIEKKMPHLFDFVFYAEAERNRQMVPNGYHKYTLFKGRRPRTVAPKDLHVGKSWRFDSRNPESWWDKVIMPYDAAWIEDAVDWLGTDPEEADADRGEFALAGANHDLGEILLLISRANDLTAYRKIWESNIAPLLENLPAEHAAQVRAAHDKKKIELAGETK